MFHTSSRTYAGSGSRSSSSARIAGVTRAAAGSVGSVRSPASAKRWRPLRLIEPEALGEGVEHLGRHRLGPALFELGQPRDGDPGDRCQLLAPQPGGAAAVGDREPDRCWIDPFAP